MTRFSPTRYTLLIVTALVITISILSWSTNGFETYTYESARRAAINKAPIQLSTWKLQNEVGESVTLDSFGDDILFVDFIYTRCPTICRALGSRYHQLQTLIDNNELHHVTLLSISVDPDFDTPAILTQYRNAHQGIAGSWQLARPADLHTRQTMLDETGLRVIPDEWGGFAHSDSIHMIRNGELTLITDWNSDVLEALIRDVLVFSIDYAQY